VIRILVWHKILQLSYRLISSVIRIIAVSLLFYFEPKFARDVLLILSSIYLFQIVSGLEIYLNPKDSRDDHLSKIIYTGLLFLPLTLLYFWINDIELLWGGFFFIDYILVEISRKQNVNNEILDSNKIAIKRALFFFVASIFSFYNKDYFLLVLIIPTLFEIFLKLSKSGCKISKIPLRLVFKNLSIVAILITITNRSIDLAIRNVNQDYNGFIYEFWDFFLTIFGVSSTITFYLFIADRAKKVLKNEELVPLKAYFLQPIIIFVLIFLSLLYFNFIKGSVDLSVEDVKIITEIYIISLIMALFQVHNWNLLALRGNGSHNNTIYLAITALIGLLSALIISINYLLYMLMLILLIVTFFGIIKRYK
jgi:hypothetical protein